MTWKNEKEAVRKEHTTCNTSYWVLSVSSPLMYHHHPQHNDGDFISHIKNKLSLLILNNNAVILHVM